jgi:rSAM/selenodomain-associated transferase 2
VDQIIVADGCSSDATATIALSSGATLVRSSPGRGTQLNAGAAAATGEVLLFVHADTRLPDDFVRHVRETLARPGVVAGAFQLRIDAAGGSFRLVEKCVNWRCRYRRMPYGDQAVFTTAAMFNRVGGFPEFPAMEDYELIRRLRRVGRVAIAPAAVVTSARRWRSRGVWRTTILNQWCIAAYRLGIAPARIAHWRSKRTRHVAPPVQTAATTQPLARRGAD